MRAGQHGWLHGPRALLSVAALLVLACVGCATKPLPLPTAREELEVWLSEAPRTIAVRMDQDVPTAVVRSRDYHTGERVGGALGGAVGGGLYTVAAGCLGGGPLGCIFGVVLAPVGMVVGGVAKASKVQSTDSLSAVTEAAGAPEM